MNTVIDLEVIHYGGAMTAPLAIAEGNRAGGAAS